MYVYIHAYVGVRMYIFKYVCIYLLTYMYIYIYIYMFIYLYTHKACVCMIHPKGTPYVSVSIHRQIDTYICIDMNTGWLRWRGMVLGRTVGLSKSGHASGNKFPKWGLS